MFRHLLQSFIDVSSVCTSTPTVYGAWFEV